MSKTCDCEHPKPNVDALAREIAEKWLYDWVTSDHWFGYPRTDEEEEAEIQSYAEVEGRAEAIRLLKLAEVWGDE